MRYSLSHATYFLPGSAPGVCQIGSAAVDAQSDNPLAISYTDMKNGALLLSVKVDPLGLTFLALFDMRSTRDAALNVTNKEWLGNTTLNGSYLCNRHCIT